MVEPKELGYFDGDYVVPVFVLANFALACWVLWLHAWAGLGILHVIGAPTIIVALTGILTGVVWFSRIHHILTASGQQLLLLTIAGVNTLGSVAMVGGAMIAASGTWLNEGPFWVHPLSWLPVLVPLAIAGGLLFITLSHMQYIMPYLLRGSQPLILFRVNAVLVAVSTISLGVLALPGIIGLPVDTVPNYWLLFMLGLVAGSVAGTFSLVFAKAWGRFARLMALSVPLCIGLSVYILYNAVEYAISNRSHDAVMATATMIPGLVGLIFNGIAWAPVMAALK